MWTENPSSADKAEPLAGTTYVRHGLSPDLHRHDRTRRAKHLALSHLVVFAKAFRLTVAELLALSSAFSAIFRQSRFQIARNLPPSYNGPGT